MEKTPKNLSDAYPILKQECKRDQVYSDIMWTLGLIAMGWLFWQILPK